MGFALAISEYPLRKGNSRHHPFPDPPLPLPEPLAEADERSREPPADDSLSSSEPPTEFEDRLREPPADDSLNHHPRPRPPVDPSPLILINKKSCFKMAMSMISMMTSTRTWKKQTTIQETTKKAVGRICRGHRPTRLMIRKGFTLSYACRRSPSIPKPFPR